MAPEDVLGDAELRADAADLVLEQPAQRLDHIEVHDLREPADVVMRLDARARLRLATARLDHVGIDRALHEELDSPDLLRLRLELANEFLADDRALLLGVLDVREPIEEALRRVDVHEPQARSE